MDVFKEDMDLFKEDTALNFKRMEGILLFASCIAVSRLSFNGEIEWQSGFSV
jgi:hypothetical protein